MEVRADLVALPSVQVVALLASGLEEVGTLLGVTCDCGQRMTINFLMARRIAGRTGPGG